MKASMIGLDIAKSVFQVHGEDAAGEVVGQRRLARGEVEKFFAGLAAATVAMEACGSAHHWARRLRELGHEVVLIPAHYVKPFVRRNKTDARDAAAIVAALRHPDTPRVPVKTVEQSAARGLERARDLLMRQQTQLGNALRGLLAEIGVVAPAGRRGLGELAGRIAAGDAAIAPTLLPAVQALLAQWQGLATAIGGLEKQIVARTRSDAAMRRLIAVPGLGPLLAHGVVTAIGDGRRFRSGRDFAAWLGLTPREHQSGERRRHGGISRAGDGALRRLFVLGASAVMRHRRANPARATLWQRGILARRPVKVAVVAQAAKTARIVWAMLARGTEYRSAAAA